MESELDGKLLFGIAMIVVFSIFLFLCLLDRITDNNSHE